MMTARPLLSMAILALTLPAGLRAQDWGPTLVGVTPARQAEVQAVVHLAGAVQAQRASLVAAEVPGVVSQLEVREGDAVDRGAPLARLRHTAVSRDLEGAQAQFEEAQARLTLAKTSLDRSRGLRDSGVISRQQFDDAETEVGAWQGRADQARALIRRLEVQIAASVVRAPFSGTVVREHCQLGEWVAAGGPVVEMVDPRRLEVLVNVPERHYPGTLKGAKARVRFDSLPGFEVEGTITAVIPRADPQTRTFPVKVEIDNADGRIGVGMSATVAFPGSGARQATVVPRDAVISNGTERAVYRVETGPPGDDGQASTVANLVPVVVGAGLGDWVEVDGVASGDSIVTRGNERLAPGSPVITEPTEYLLP